MTAFVLLPSFDFETCVAEIVRRQVHRPLGLVAALALCIAGNNCKIYDLNDKVVREIKLDAEDSARPESELADFALPEEVCRLVAQIEAMGTGCIQRIEVRAGVPRRVLIEVAPLENAL
jgi:hypothetical protein